MPTRRRKNKTASAIAEKKRAALVSGTHSRSFFAKFLDCIGIRPIQPDAPFSIEQRKTIRFDVIVAIIVLIVSLATRFYRLAIPKRVVFDEIHFAAFIDQYNKGTYLFDIHPPLGKLTLLVAAKLGGYQSIDFKFDALGRPFDDLVYFPQRALSAFAGSLIPPVMYLTARTVSLPFVTSFTTAAMPLFDILLCIESRLILVDSQLILYLQAAYLCAFLLWQTPRSTPRRYKLLVLTAFTAACALSTKWTAFVAPLAIAFVSLTGVIFPHSRLDVVEMAIAAVVAAVVYVGSFWIHFELLPRSGPGDAFMRDDFQRTLIGNPMFKASAPKLPFLSNFWYLNWEMLRANSAIETRHQWESKWYQWLYNGRGILYSDERLPGDRMFERVYLIVNPVLTVITGFGVVVGCMYIVVKGIRMYRDWRKLPPVRVDGGGEAKGNQNSAPGIAASAVVRQNVGLMALLFVSWCANLLPYVGIKRCTFLYHVLPALQLSSLMTGIMINSLPLRGLRNFLCALLVVAMAGAFYWWRPMIYAFPRHGKELYAMQLMPGWT